MNLIFSTLPVAILIAYSQLMVKWRILSGPEMIYTDSRVKQLLSYLTDPFILSAYAAGLFGSFAWLLVITKLPLSLAFPVYQGITFILVLLGGSIILGESLTATKILATTLILVGVAIGVRS